MWKQLTGEPVAGKPHTGFGGRGRRAPFPTLSNRFYQYQVPPTQNVVVYVISAGDPAELDFSLLESRGKCPDSVSHGADIGLDGDAPRQGRGAASAPGDSSPLLALRQTFSGLTWAVVSIRTDTASKDSLAVLVIFS